MLGREAYLREVRDLVWFAHRARAPLSVGCEYEVRQLKEQLNTDVHGWEETRESHQNDLTEFLDELDIDTFEDVGME